MSNTILRDCSKNIPYLVADSSVSPTGLKWAAPAASGFVGVDAYNLGSQTISNNTFTALTFDSEVFDTDGFHSTSSNTSRITIPSGKGGYYLIRSATQIQNNATGERLMRFYKNGSFADPQFRLGFDSDGHASQILVTWMNLASGDYIECFVLQNSGGNLNYDPSYFGVQYLGA